MIEEPPIASSTQPLIAETLSAALGPISVSELQRILDTVRLSCFAAGSLVRFESAPELRVVVTGIVAGHDRGGTGETKYFPGQLLPSDAHADEYRALREVLVARISSKALEGWDAARVLHAWSRSGARSPAKLPLLVGVSGSDPRIAAELHGALSRTLARFGSVSSAIIERSPGALPSRLELSAWLVPADFQLLLFPSPARPTDAPEVDRWLYAVDGQRAGDGCPMPRRRATEQPGGIRMSTAVPRTTPSAVQAPCLPGEPGLMPRTLIICHPASCKLPHATRHHLAYHKPDEHRHVRRGNAADHQRLARELAGVPVGFTLGAGGARGLAHLGVLLAADEAGLPIDTISGTSIGAVIGALVGMGRDAEARREAAERLASARPFWDFALPTTALLRGRRFEALADEFFGDGVELEDLWIPMVTMTCELSDFHETVHRRGSLRDILLAGIVLPGVLPPRVLDGKLHVDGGTSDMLPVALLRAHSPGPIVAVDVSPWNALPVSKGPYPVGANALLARLRGKSAPLGAHQVFWRAVSYFVAARSRVEGARADLLISPDVGSIGTSALECLREIERKGYVAARAAFASAAGQRLLDRAAPRVADREQPTLVSSSSASTGG